MFSYKRARAVIYLNDYSLRRVEKLIGGRNEYKSIIIGHGINQSVFSGQIKKERIDERVLKLIYVSTINLYKHQWLLMNVIDQLNESGYRVELIMIGESTKLAHRKFVDKFKSLKHPQFIKYMGVVEYDRLVYFYNRSDAFIFGSSCETFGNVVLEAMACGLPVLCSNSSSMPSTFGDVPIYFDIFDDVSIRNAIATIYDNRERLSHLSTKSSLFANNISWRQTSKETFKYLSLISKKVNLVTL